MLGTGIIDAHVHLYPAEVAADPAAWAARMGEPLWGALVTPHPARRVKQGWADHERLLRDMDAAGIERSILLGWYWQRQETCSWHNRYYASCVRAHPDRLSAFATVQAAAGPQAIAEMERCRDEGFIGLGELCPWQTAHSPLDPHWLAVFEHAVRLGWPVNLHVTDPVSHAFPGRVDTPLESIIRLAETLPNLPLILAHWGGGLPFHEWHPRARRALRHAYYDTAATPLLYDPAIYAAARAAIGGERVLFGSDYPLLVFPATQTEPNLAQVLNHACQPGLDADTRAAMLGANARKLLRLSPST